jgi:hypothetical protein
MDDHTRARFALAKEIHDRLRIIKSRGSAPRLLHIDATAEELADALAQPLLDGQGNRRTSFRVGATHVVATRG